MFPNETFLCMLQVFLFCFVVVLHIIDERRRTKPSVSFRDSRSFKHFCNLLLFYTRNINTCHVLLLLLTVPMYVYHVVHCTSYIIAMVDSSDVRSATDLVLVHTEFQQTNSRCFTRGSATASFGMVSQEQPPLVWFPWSEISTNQTAEPSVGHSFCLLYSRCSLY